MEQNSYKYYILQLAFCIRILAFCIRILPSSILHYAYCIRLYGHYKLAAVYSIMTPCTAIMHYANYKLPYGKPHFYLIRGMRHYYLHSAPLLCLRPADSCTRVRFRLGPISKQ